jgi:cytochrome c-type biogenesis protein CcmH
LSSGFVALAILLLIVSVGLVVWPLWRSGTSPRATVAALALAGALPLAAVLLYKVWSNHDWSEPAMADSPAAMVARLARRLERDPDDKPGWLQLGQSYLVLGQLPMAARAFERADRLAGGTDATALLGWAEALFRADEREIEGRAGRLFERALELEPTSGKALLFAAIAAQRRGELPLARERFVRVLAAGPPADLRGAIEAQIAQLDGMVAGAPPGAAAAAAGASAGAGPPARVRVTVELGKGLNTAEFAAVPLFVLARRPGEPGPPLAVKRVAARFPQDVELTAADAMLPGRELVAGDTVEVVARLSRSGAPTASAGDPFGMIRYAVGKDARVSIIIDQITPAR